MGRSLVIALLALVGLLCAAGMGYAAYVVSRGSVAVPVTRLQQTPAQQLAPAHARTRSTPTTTRTVAPPAPTTTVDDRGGRGSGSSGRGGGGHGGDD
jgi:flagellar basal body-associated protein FliL